MKTTLSLSGYCIFFVAYIVFVVFAATRCQCLFGDFATARRKFSTCLTMTMFLLKVIRVISAIFLKACILASPEEYVQITFQNHVILALTSF